MSRLKSLIAVASLTMFCFGAMLIAQTERVKVTDSATAVVKHADLTTILRDATVHIIARHKDGTVFADEWGHQKQGEPDLITTGGVDMIANALSATSSRPAQSNTYTVFQADPATQTSST